MKTLEKHWKSIGKALKLRRSVAHGRSVVLGPMAASTGRGAGWRHVNAVLVMFIVTISYADRKNLGIALASDALPGCGPEHKGTVLAAFYVGYTFTQYPGGLLAIRYGAKPCLLVAALAWTLFDLLSVPAARLSRTTACGSPFGPP